MTFRIKQIATAALSASVFITACARSSESTRVATTAAGDSSSDLSIPPAVPDRVPAQFPAGWRFAAGSKGTVAPNSMAVSNSPAASAAADEILKAGGNAVDAAVALGFALTVTWPVAGNIGGGGYMVIRMANGSTEVIDYREVAPLAATRDMYLDSNGKVTDKSLVGHLASGVPGSVAGMAAALAKYGTMPLSRVMQPAIRLAREGFVVDSGLYLAFRAGDTLLRKFEGARIYIPQGKPLPVGARLVQPDLARTLQAIADGGPKAFYEGWIADSLVAEMRRGGGIITREDLARYQPAWRTPIRTSYRGYGIIAMPPSSSGGITTAEALNILDQYPALPSFASAGYAHIVGSAFQRAFIDRNGKLGDPAFVKAPIEQLMSKKYAKALRATINDNRASRTADLDSLMKQAAREPMNTTHYSVVDGKGNAVATTTTLNNSFGSGVWVRGAGFMMNDEMDDFTSKPGVPNMFGLVQGEQNAIQPGKRMLSAMSPTIVTDSKNNVLLVLGGAGGPTIITGVTQVILNVLENRMSLGDAMRAPRLHHQALPDSLTYEKGGLSSATLDSLTKMGYRMRPINALVNINAIMRVNGGWEGVFEPRRSGAAIGH